MPLPSSGQIMLSAVNVELGRPANQVIGLGDSAVRALFNVPSTGAISMSQGYGKSNVFAFNISSNQTSVNLRQLAINAGWNQSAKVQATISSGVYVSSANTGSTALTIDGSFPNGVVLINNGFIVGMGGAGGAGSPGLTYGPPGSPGASGGRALLVSVGVQIQNNGTIGGGGGGGGGGGQVYEPGDKNNSYPYGWGGGGGGGGRTGTTNSAGGAASNSFSQRSRVGTAGSVGTSTSGGAGGVSHAAPNFSYRGGDGGSGGNWGATGSAGQTGFGPGYPVTAGGAGGAAGAAISGNANITWLATGTRLGAIT